MSSWRNTREYRVWRASVIRRDKVCVVCGSRKRRQAHHIDHSMYFPDKRFDVSNGVTMCSKCHMQFHSNFKRSTRVKCTKYDFDNFMSLVSYIKTL